MIRDRSSARELLSSLLRSRIGIFFSLTGIVFLVSAAFTRLIPWWLFVVGWVVLIALLAIYVYVVPWWAERKDAQLEAGLDEQNQRAIGRQRVRDRDALKELHAKWKDSVETLKRSRVGRGRRPLYFLPWYVIVGAPASGKTTAIENSGLRFPIGAPKLSGTGGTRNCDWWFADQAIILDTAGRYTFDDDHAPDREEWLAFLKLLRKYRPLAPINGVMIAIAADSLIARETGEVTSDARNMRQKVDQIVRELGIQFPIYLLITKCDLVEGFTDFFGRLPKKRFDEMLGWTSPGWHLDEPRKTVADAMGALRERALSLRTAFLWEEDDPEQLRRIYLFPEELRSLTSSIEEFCEELFRETQYNESPFLRGIYLTSGLQKGTTISRMLSRLGMQSQARELREERRSFFLKDFFQSQLPLDKNLVAATGRSRGATQAVQNLTFATVAAICLVAATLFSWSYVRNRTLLLRVQDEVDLAASTVALPPLDRLNGLDRYETALEELNDHNQHRPISMGYGLYTGYRVYVPALDLFIRRFGQDAYQPAIGEAKHEIERRDLDRGYGALIALIQDVLLSRQVNHSQVEAYGYNDQLVAFWPGAKDIPIDQLAADETLLKAYGKGYLAFLRFRSQETAREDESSEISLIKQALPEMFTVERVSERASRLFPAKAAETIPLPKSIGNGAVVPGAFTKDAWDQWIGPLADRFELISGAIDEPNLVPGFRHGYFDRYFGQWLRFFLQLREAPANAVPLDVLLSDRSPYLLATDFVSDQISIEAGKPAQPAWAKSLLRVDGQRSAYLAVLRDLSRALAAAKQDPQHAVAETKEIYRRRIVSALDGGDESAHAEDPYGKVELAVYAAVGSAGSGGEDDEAVRRHVSALLRAPIYEAFHENVQIVAHRIDEDWRRQVVAPASAATAADATAFYRKDSGPVWAFIRENVEPFFEGGLNGPLKVRYRNVLPIDKARFSFLHEADDQNAALFAPGGGYKQHHLMFTSVPTNSPGQGGFLPTKTTLSVFCQDGVPWQHVHQNYRAQKALTWSPDMCTKAEISVEIANAEGERRSPLTIGFDDQFGLARLLMRAERRGDEFTWHLPGDVDVTYIVTGISPKMLSQLVGGGAKPPTSIVQ